MDELLNMNISYGGVSADEAEQNMSFQLQQARERLKASQEARDAMPTQNDLFMGIYEAAGNAPEQQIPIDPTLYDTAFPNEGVVEVQETEDTPLQAPQIIVDAFSPNKFSNQINRVIYGDETILEAKEAIEIGRFNEDQFQPLQHIQEIASATGEDTRIIGAFMVARADPTLRTEVIKLIGLNRFTTLSRAVQQALTAQEERENQDGTKPSMVKAVLQTGGDIIADLGTFAFKDIGDSLGLAAGRAGHQIASIGNVGGRGGWAYELSQTIGHALNGIPLVNSAVNATGLMDIEVGFTPYREETIAWIKAQYPHIEAAQNLTIGQRSTFWLNFEELKAWQYKFGDTPAQLMSERREQLLEARAEEIESVTGHIVAAVGEFGIIYFASPNFASRVEKAADVINGFARFRKVVSDGIIRGEIAAQVMYRDGDDTLMEMATGLGIPDSLIPELLTTDPNDPEWMNRLKIGVEGAALGAGINVTVDSVGLLFRSGVKARNGDFEGATEDLKDAAAAQAYSNVAEMQSTLGLNLPEYKLQSNESGLVGTKLSDLSDAELNDLESLLSSKFESGELPRDFAQMSVQQGVQDLNAIKIERRRRGTSPEGETEGTPEGAPEAASNRAGQQTTDDATDAATAADDTARAADDATDAADDVDQTPSGSRLIDTERENLNRADIENAKILDTQFTHHLNRRAIGDVDQSHLRGILGDNWVGEHDDLLTVDLPALRASDTVFTSDEFARLQSRFRETMSKLQKSKTMEQHREEALKVLQDLKGMYGEDAFQKLLDTPIENWTNQQTTNLYLANMVRDKLNGDYIKVTRALRDAMKHMERDEERIFELKRIQLSLIQTMNTIQFDVAGLARDASAALNAAKAIKKSQAIREQSMMHYNYLVEQNKLDKKSLEQLIKSDPNTAQLYEQMLRRARKNTGKNTLTEEELQELFLDGAMHKSSAEYYDAVKRSKDPGFWEKVLYWSNANILWNAKTQMMMGVSNILRTAIEPITDLLQFKPIQAANRMYFTALAVKHGFKAFNRMFKTGDSDFGLGAMLDEDGLNAQKNISEILKLPEAKNPALYVGDLGQKAADLLYRFMGSFDEMTKEIIMQSDMAVSARMGNLTDELQEITKRGRIPTDEDYLRALHQNMFTKRTMSGRVILDETLEFARDASLNREAAEGSWNKGVQSLVQNNTSARLILMRFVRVPLNVAEARLATSMGFVPLALNALGMHGLNVAIFGKFAEDLKSTNPRLKARTRAVLVGSTAMTALGFLHAFTKDRDDLEEVMELDPASPNYLGFRVEMDGNVRYINPRDAEVPYLNSFQLGVAFAHFLDRIEDPTDKLDAMDGIQMMSAVFLNETLEKSSVTNAVDTIAAITDDNLSGIGQMIVNQISAYVPFNNMTRDFINLTREGGAFPGKPRDFYEQLFKAIPSLQVLVKPLMNNERTIYGTLAVSESKGMNPFISRKRVETPLDVHLKDLEFRTGKSFVRESVTRLGVELDELRLGDGMSWWDNLQEVLGNGDVTIGGKTLEQSLTDLVTSELYRNIGEEWETRVTEGQELFTEGGKLVDYSSSWEDWRVSKVQEILTEYQKLALIRVYQNAPEEDKQEFDRLSLLAGGRILLD